MEFIKNLINCYFNMIIVNTYLLNIYGILQGKQSFSQGKYTIFPIREIKNIKGDGYNEIHNGNKKMQCIRVL